MKSTTRICIFTLLIIVFGIGLLTTTPKTEQNNKPFSNATPLGDSLRAYSDDIEHTLNTTGIKTGEYKGLAWFYETCNTQLCQYLPHDVALTTSVTGNNRHACYEILLETLKHKRVTDYDDPENITDQRIHYWIHQPQYYKSKLCFDIYDQETAGVYRAGTVRHRKQIA